MHDIPDFSSLIGIINCFNVLRPDLIHEVIAIGRAIFNTYIKKESEENGICEDSLGARAGKKILDLFEKRKKK